ncbi:penicillin-binding protein [Brachybacterium phenoliresistens]|uniref:Penicillin-binding protein n=1 Tax=Brachybacterium phenoliresistens TaxID=396014 RepID=Z9JSC8_9MICO|nr:penicillin-binding transpeptidase domain-containing protein [Brachybacterium phenoliresistens]EWS81285.1 penicillin-binding protein [Brachybacterium phenoliresistens]
MTRDRPRLARRLVLGAGLVAAAGAGGALLLTRGGDGTAEADALLAALRSGDFTAAPLADPDAAAQERERIIGPLLALDGAEVELSAHDLAPESDGRRELSLRWSWSLPGFPEPWEVEAGAALVRGDEGWQARLSPATYAAGLGEREHLELRSIAPELGRVRDRRGTELLGPRQVLVVGIDKTALDPAEQDGAARDLAALLGIDADRYAGTVADSGPQAFVPALTVRVEEAQERRLDEAAQLPGYHEVEQTRPLSVRRGIAPGVLGSLREASAEDLAEDPSLQAGDLVGTGGVVAARRDQILGTPGAKVLATDPDADRSRELHRRDPVDGTEVTISLDLKLQDLATERLAGTEAPSAVVALRPSTGELLAAALGPRTQEYPIGLVGRYAPGSTFKTVTALSLLRAGDTPDTVLQCPERAVVDGRSFKNADSLDPGLFGPLPLSDVIAHSCNTALLLQHDRVSQEALAEAAAALGVGQEEPEGLDAYMGAVGTPNSTTEHAAAMMGQGQVLASPLTMAVVLASVVRGETVAPRILTDAEPAAPAPAVPLTAAEAEQLRGLLGGVVEHGSLDDFRDLPGDPVIGKTGTAEWIDGEGALSLHSWVIVAQGDLALAVFVEKGSYGSVTAGPIGLDVLRGAADLV